MSPPDAVLSCANWFDQVAVDEPVAVAVGPGARRVALEPRAATTVAAVERRVVDDVLRLVDRGLQVLADVHLDGRLARAEHVPGRAPCECVMSFHPLTPSVRGNVMGAALKSDAWGAPLCSAGNQLQARS